MDINEKEEVMDECEGTDREDTSEEESEEVKGDNVGLTNGRMCMVNGELVVLSEAEEANSIDDVLDCEDEEDEIEVKDEGLVESSDNDARFGNE
ncbi:hypothetical protein PHLCEN_2v5680 [Hermanssonia centrifuga]|uniref:Uncharacterized protein n=1 Tax=Hermanssonia centrifuga TaxID=98765 RepID=A0A2R6P1P7_9APHY|nr:hypothetical protein PHLCEN_2v5680 [Hermanssonia centrifuga]